MTAAFFGTVESLKSVQAMIGITASAAVDASRKTDDCKSLLTQATREAGKADGISANRHDAPIIFAENFNRIIFGV